MTPRGYTATAGRVLRQLVGDRRTLALVLAVPAALVSLLYLVYRDHPAGPGLFDHIAITMTAILPMSLMFSVTSVTMLRERSLGTLERLWTTPLRRADLLLGYATAFTAAALGQAVVLSAVCAWALDVRIAASWAWVVATALLDGFVGVALGLVLSAFARNEFQAVQFLPVVVVPQVFLCGLLVPRAQLPQGLHQISSVLPMSWAVDVVNDLAVSAAPGQGSVHKLVLLACAGLAVLVAAAATMPRCVR